MKLNKVNRIETSDILKTQGKNDKNRIIIEQSLNNNLFNNINNHSNIFYFISKLKNIILFSI